MRILVCLAAAFFLGVAGPALAGTAEVNFVDADDYTDAKDGDGSNEVTLREVRAHLVDLAQRRLPADQVLKIDVIDINLAGQLDVKRFGKDIRFMGPDDEPRMTLRFVLTANGQMLLSGEDKLIDPNFMRALGRPTTRPDPLRLERPMLTKWFESRFVRSAPPAG